MHSKTKDVGPFHIRALFEYGFNFNIRCLDKRNFGLLDVVNTVILHLDFADAARTEIGNCGSVCHWLVVSL